MALKAPLDSQIKAGYNINKMVFKAVEYGWKAYHDLEQSIEDMKVNGDLVNQYDVAKEKSEILRIMAVVQQRGELLHKRLAKKMLSYGYRPLTNADFDGEGAGGLR